MVDRDGCGGKQASTYHTLILISNGSPINFISSAIAQMYSHEHEIHFAKSFRCFHAVGRFPYQQSTFSDFGRDFSQKYQKLSIETDD